MLSLSLVIVICLRILFVITIQVTFQVNYLSNQHTLLFILRQKKVFDNSKYMFTTGKKPFSVLQKT